MYHWENSQYCDRLVGILEHRGNDHLFEANNNRAWRHVRIKDAEGKVWTITELVTNSRGRQLSNIDMVGKKVMCHYHPNRKGTGLVADCIEEYDGWEERMRMEISLPQLVLKELEAEQSA